MKKIISIFVAVFVGVGMSSAVWAAVDGGAPGTDVHSSCKSKADGKKLTGHKADKFIDACVKKASKKKNSSHPGT